MSPAVDRASLETRLIAEGLTASVWSNLPGDRYDQHVHDYDKVVVAVEGSVTFGLSGYGVGFVLAPGERLDLPANVAHDAVVGPKGVTCLEGHLPAGTLGQACRPNGGAAVPAAGFARAADRPPVR
jgi:quercetin dioxygenase-like cupin family protein